MRRRLSLLIVPLAFAAFALIPAATSAGGGGGGPFPTTSTLSVGGKGTLVVGGVVISVNYSCLPNGGYSGFGYAQVSDSTGSGYTFWNPTCNDKKQSQNLFIPGSFTAGYAGASASVCGFDCAYDSREIQVK